MTKTKMSYFSEEDILHLMISEDEEANSIELSPNITAELNESELIGIEILQASEFVRDAIMEGVQAKILNLVAAGKTDVAGRVSPMQTANVIYWEEEGGWIGYLEEHPAYWTQGDSLDDLREHLEDLYRDLTNGEFSGRPPAQRAGRA
jgi:predicted RNase H-like HicB family nuclease/uncharacterized protein YuzE